MGWTNQDGLYIRFGLEEGATGRSGEYRRGGPLREEELTIDLASLTNTSTVLDLNNFLPKDGFIESVVVETKVAATGGASALNVGLYRSDGTTAISEVGLVNALPLASMTPAGMRANLTPGVTGAGDYLGKKPGFRVRLSAKWSGAAFTAGIVAVRVYWSK